MTCADGELISVVESAVAPLASSLVSRIGVLYGSPPTIVKPDASFAATVTATLAGAPGAMSVGLTSTATLLTTPPNVRLTEFFCPLRIIVVA
ncbi:hypothetical protein WPS_15710 [Vulcanimicrobium alpinum]|uniref:Uncharacterized protein n=1 Tax=Vulcanimicrobium alpinum TaxID=3016050 RepID=A0AAN1XWJ6_UNVUL|nr:hypothetical protein WPS_15710 [Vulcanimicrobium alpinum]